jgi:hypothetical protein
MIAGAWMIHRSSAPSAKKSTKAMNTRSRSVRIDMSRSEMRSVA